MIQSTAWDAAIIEADELAQAEDAVRGAELDGVPLTGGPDDRSPDLGKAKRGTTNGNARGNPTDRQRRRAWLVTTYRANLDVLVVKLGNGAELHLDTMFGRGEPACRCYRCGRLLTAQTVTVDRIIPGCRGGTYRRDNIRPSCQPCASLTGAALGNERKRARSARL